MQVQVTVTVELFQPLRFAAGSRLRNAIDGLVSSKSKAIGGAGADVAGLVGALPLTVRSVPSGAL